MMKLKIISGILAALIVAISLSGCVDNSIYGAYTYSTSKLVLQEDSTYLYYPDVAGTAQKGAYSQNHNEIQLTNILGMTTILKTVNGGLIDDEGNIWRKV